MRKNETIAKCILEILRYQPVIVMSWGLDSQSLRIAEADNMTGLSFSVNGFKHKGKVQVLYNEGLDLFEIRLLGKDDSILTKKGEVYFDELVSTIDNLVEKTINYKESVMREYGFSQQ